MVIQCHWKKALLVLVALCVAAACITSFCMQSSHRTAIVAGGNIHSIPHSTDFSAAAVTRQEALDYSERFQRPSNRPPLPNPYSFAYFSGQSGESSTVTTAFQSPEGVILAYYGILKSASNMQGFSGGCGSVGDTGAPYPYAYQLFTVQARNAMPFQQFKGSFRGIGHITLLQLSPAYSPAGTPQNLQYYMIELETIAGEKENTAAHQAKSRFAYYYGLAAVENTPRDGWRIKKIDYLPEDFLCAPYHGWSFDAEALVGIVYMDNLKIIDKIERTEQKGTTISVYASGEGGQYRFDFIRITNGYDILMHEFIRQGKEWSETSLLSGSWKSFKLSADNLALSHDMFSVGG